MTRLWKWIRRAVSWLLCPFRRQEALPVAQPPDGRLRAVMVEEQPDDLRPGECYLVGEGEHRWFAAFACPCGCGADVVLNLLPDMRPRWRIDIHDDETVTVSPSINRHRGCRAHFYVRRGQTQWCADSPSTPDSSHAGS